MDERRWQKPQSHSRRAYAGPRPTPPPCSLQSPWPALLFLLRVPVPLMFEIFAFCGDFPATPIFFIFVAAIRAPQRFSRAEATRRPGPPGPPRLLGLRQLRVLPFCFGLCFSQYLPASSRHHHDAAVGDMVSLGAVRFQVETDRAGIGNLHAGIHNCPPDPAVAADFTTGH